MNYRMNLINELYTALVSVLKILSSKNALNWLRVDIYNVRKYYISNKYCSFELSIYLWILKNKMYHGFHKNIW